ncbi:hypothetical protein Tco_1507037 [Tanacetum coccineum]
MTQLLVKDAPFNFSEECIQAFDTLKRELTAGTNPDQIRFGVITIRKHERRNDYAVVEEFDIEIRDKKGAKI